MLDDLSPDLRTPNSSVVLLVALLLMMVGVIVGSLLALALAQWVGIDLQAVTGDSAVQLSTEQRTGLRGALLLNNLVAFTLTALITVVIFYRRRWAHYLQLRTLPTLSVLGLGMLWLLASFPLVQLSYWLNQQVKLPTWMRSLEQDNTGLIEAMLVNEGPGELLLTLLVAAVTPALGEELFFRGLIQQQLRRGLRNPHLAIWLTAILFSTIHLQFAGFLPRLLLGALLGYSFYWTRNLWIPIILHFCFNGMQVLLNYFVADPAALEAEGQELPHWALLTGSVLLFSALSHTLWQHRQRSTDS